jgi:hypothetical protein
MAQMPQTDYYLSPRELAHLFHVHINTLRRWGDRTVLKMQRIGRRVDRRFIKEIIAEFLAGNGNGSFNSKPTRAHGLVTQ